MTAKQEVFEAQLLEYGCGYYKSCYEHACPCNISINHRDRYDESIDKSLREEARKAADDLDAELGDDGLFTDDEPHEENDE